jgi:hypothetical protein
VATQTLSLQGAERRSNPLPDEPRNAHQAEDCFVALLLVLLCHSICTPFR